MFQIFHTFTPRRESKYRNLEYRYNFDCILYPTPLHQIKTFEKYNISINVFAIEKSVDVYPLKVVRQKKSEHWDLLLTNDNGRSQYAYIKDFNKLVASQISGHKSGKHGCNQCLTNFN